MISPVLEQHARALGAFLALLAIANPRDFHKGGLLLVVQVWLRETWQHVSRYVRKDLAGVEWVSDRVRATRVATRREERRRTAQRSAMKRYERGWLANVEFVAESKLHANKRFARKVG